MSKSIVVTIAVKSLLSLLTTGIFLFPAWVFLFLRTVAQPTGFWQNFAMGVAGIALLGGVQVVLIIVLIAVLIALWAN